MRIRRLGLDAFVVSAIVVRTGLARAEEGGRDLVALARSGVRPSECGGTVGAPALRWKRAAEPRLGPYCDALARGFALVGASPKDALELARAADRALPGRATPSLLEGRAQAGLGAYSEAWAAFEKARSRGLARVDAPAVLHSMAVSALRTGHVDAALDAFRALVSRIELVEDGALELEILIEASVLTMSRGPEHIPEAVGYLSEARRRPRLPGLSDYVTGALALAYDRQGLADEAAGVAAEATGPWRLESDREKIERAAGLPQLPAGEIDAMIAVLAERHDRELCLDRFQSYSETDAGRSGPFAEWARRRLERLLGKAKARHAQP